ncbi:secretion protein HlyD [Affinibrenneria salicis]|uniref:Secretion protein HlyD n=1 Tax=Affinibrenneria salicis TaxID=2590031 RepID=A0A5J5G1H5_9GAMM|nr:secretion protein HlyD [Affinibrenneria salicis]KAA9000596.1 secretion protein HlyD [Affinibrenneria salicis]
MNKKKWAVAIVILAIIVALIYGVMYYRQQQQKPLTLYGNVDIRTVNVAFRVGGRLASLAVDEGDAVRQGQPLAVLDDAPYQNALREAQANVASARAKLALLQEGYRSEEIAQVRSQVGQAQAAFNYANSFWQRQQGLWARRTIAANTLEDARAARDQAQSALQAAKDKLNQYERGNRPQEIAAANAALAQSEAAQAQAELDLQDSRLPAPSDGVILTRAVEPGSILSAGSTVFTVSLTRPVWVRAYVNETQLQEAQPGREVEIYSDGRPDKPWRGKIGFVSPSAEFTPKTVETEELRTDLVYRLRIVVADPDDQLRQGMPVTLRFTDDGRAQ